LLRLDSYGEKLLKAATAASVQNELLDIGDGSSPKSDFCRKMNPQEKGEDRRILHKSLLHGPPSFGLPIVA
jgi:hypothetical protein